MPGDLIDSLKAIHAILERLGVPHALIGGLAANLYRAEVRATTDVDLAVAINPPELVGVVDALAEDGWAAEPYWRQGNQLRLTKGDLPRVDCVIAGTDLERTAIARAQIGPLGVTVVTAEDLVVMKLIAGRARDYEAVASIINARADRLDEDYIRNWLSEFDALAAWDRAIDEARREAN